MILFFNTIDSPYVCCFDIEHDQGDIIQFSGILFKNVGNGLYQIARNINVYRKKSKVSPFISSLTGIDEEFLQSYGLEEKEFKETIESFWADISTEDILFVSHGVDQDWEIMRRNGLIKDDIVYRLMCTYKYARNVLKRNKELTLKDISYECGCPMDWNHNAYNDALATAFILSYLLKIGEE